MHVSINGEFDFIISYCDWECVNVWMWNYYEPVIFSATLLKTKLQFIQGTSKKKDITDLVNDIIWHVDNSHLGGNDHLMKGD